jgi:hypothetical protein
MAIEDLKRWQWCIVGCVVGAAVGAASLATLPREKPGTETVGPRVFEEQIRDGIDPSRRHVFKVENVELHPPSAMPVPGERAVNTPFITYDVLLVRKDNPKLADRYYRNMILEIRTTRDKSLAGKLDGMSMKEYLDKVNAAIGKLDKKRFPHAQTVAYKFQWIETPKGAYPIFTLGGLVLIGFIWPTVVQLLAGNGFGRPKTEEEFSLSRYKAGKTQTKAGKAGPTEAQIDQLAQLEAELEAKLKSGEAVPAAAEVGAASGVAVKPSIKVLNAGPLEAPKEAPKADQKPKGFGAGHEDYYPTEVHGQKP